MSDGGKPYRAFLEGRVKGDSYCLLLHLTDQELKAPAKDELSCMFFILAVFLFFGKPYLMVFNDLERDEFLRTPWIN